MAKLIGQLPNLLTLVRILLVAPVAWAIWTGDFRFALLLLVIAAISDLLDGSLARRFNWQSQFGATIDPVADKLLVFTLAVLLTVNGHVPLWLALIVVMRDVVILAGAGVYRMLFGHLDVAPTWISKVNTAVQLVVLGMVLLALCRFGVMSDWLGRLLDPWGFVLVGALSVWSGVDYVITWSRRAWRQRRMTT